MTSSTVRTILQNITIKVDGSELDAATFKNVTEVLVDNYLRSQAVA